MAVNGKDTYMLKSSALVILMLMTASCGSNQWRLGGDQYNPSTIKKRDKERSKHLEHHIDERWDTTKHYVNQHKKKDGKINLFVRDGFDWSF